MARCSGAGVLGGMFTIFDEAKVLGKAGPPGQAVCLPTSNFMEGVNVEDPSYRRIIEIVIGVLSKAGMRDVFLEELEADEEAMRTYIAKATVPTFITKGTLEERKNVADGLNARRQKGDLRPFLPMAPDTEAFLITKAVFNYNRPAITGGFPTKGTELRTFLVIAMGKSTIHWVVYDEYMHYVAMAKSASASWAYSHMSMAYDPESENTRIAIALKTAEMITAFMALRAAAAA